MQTAEIKTKVRLRRASNGMLLTPEEFDAVTDYDERYDYELIHGVVIVNPIPLIAERDPNEELGRWLRNYREDHPEGKCLDKTTMERTIRLGNDRRRVDRAIWIGLGRIPKPTDPPTVAVEFVSKRKRDRQRDYVTKRDEYMAAKVKEYWVFDRYDRCLVVFTRQGGKIKQLVIRENQVYKTPLLPGFELPVAKLLALADEWKPEAK